MIRGSSTQCEDFTISLDRVAIKKEEVRGVLFCMQDFVRGPHFTQRNFFSETGLTMLSESVAIADSITSSPVYAPWRHGVLSHLPLQARSLLICAPVGIGWCYVVALPRTVVSAGIMVAPLGVKQRQGLG